MLPYINYPFEYLSSLTGASSDELKLIFSFFLSYPLAGILKRIPDSRPALKNLFIIAVSFFYLVGLFDLWSGIQTLLLSSIGAFAIAKYVEGPFMPWIGFVFLIGHMSINHLYRQFANDASTIDITGAQMVLVMKLSAFCWNIHDGRLPPSELTDFQIERALSSIPPILDYAGYVLFFPALFAGPAFDYVEYRRWLDTSMFELPPGSDPLKKPPTRKKRKIPQSSFPALLKAGAGVFWIVLFLNFSACYPREALTSPSYMTYSFPRRVLILHMFGFSTRLKYYAVWSLTEGACILSGLGYNGLDPQSGTVRWNRLQNVDPWRIETAQNSRAYLEGWNQNTNYWLRSYVYLRVTPKGKKPGFRASLATFMTSAFWHGFYPGYYLAFGLAAFIQTVAKQFRRHVRPFFLAPDGSGTSLKPAYDIFGYLATQLGFSFTVAPFILLDFRSCILVWWRVYFYAVVGVAVTMAVFASPVKPWLAKQLQSHNKRPGLVSQASQESGPVGWIPDDPAGKLDEAVQEMVLEMEARQRKGKGVVPASLSKDN